MAIVDLDLRYVRINQTLAEINGLTIEEHMGRRIDEVLPTFKHTLEPLLKEILSTGRAVLNRPISGETRAQPGKQRDWIASYFPVNDPAGRLVGLGALVVEVTALKETESALRQNQDLFQAVVDQCPEMIFLKDIEGRYLLVNRKFEEEARIPREAILGRRDAELFQADLARGFRGDDARVLAASRALTFEEQYQMHGSFKINRVSKFPLRRANGQIFGVGAIITDITEQKRADDTIRFHASLLDQVNSAVIATDELGRVVFWNRYAEKLYQWTAAEAMGRSILELTVPPDEMGGAAQILEALAAGKSWEGEFPVRRKDGTTFVAHVVDAPVLDPQGKLRGYVGVSVDLSARIRAESELRASEQRFVALFRGNPMPIATTNVATGRFIDVNDELLRTFGYTRDEMIGRTVEELNIWVSSDDREKVVGILQAGGRVKNFESLFRRKNGEVFVGQISSEMLPWSDEPVSVWMLADMTELKRAELELKNSHEQMRALASRLTVAREDEARRIARELHDGLGQQLTALQMDISYLRSRLPKNRKALVEECGRMENLVTQTIETVKKIAGELRLASLDMLGLPASIEWQLSQFQKRTGIVCSSENVEQIDGLEDERATAAFRIFQEALTNVARHAKATRVDVALSLKAEDLILEVTDNGRGITAEELENKNALGLVGMRERALALHGELQVSPRTEGGTRVRARLPKIRER